MPHHIPAVLSPHASGEEQIFIHCANHCRRVVLGGRGGLRVDPSQDRSATLRGSE